MMVGDQKKYNTMLVTLKVDGATGEVPGTDQLVGPAKSLVPGVTTVAEAQQSTEYRKAIQEAVDKVNRDQNVCQNNAWKVFV